jgi:predicted membrane protein
MSSKSTLANAAPQLIFGGFIIIVGFLFLLDNMGLINAGNLFDYWPSIFILIGLVRIVQADTGAGRMIGSIFVLVGFFWILDNVGALEVSFSRVWPVLLILIGLAVIWKGLSTPSLKPAAYRSAGPLGPSDAKTGGTADSATGDSTAVQGVAVLGGFKRVINSQDFRGGNLTAFMGGCEIDLRDASISSNPAVIDVFAFWGGVELRVPDDWVVELRGMPILGGFEDKTRPPREHLKRLVIKGMVIMGGVEVKN